MSNTTSPRPRLVLVTHESGEFIARINLPGSEAEALATVADEVGDRWSLDVTDVRIATTADLAGAMGQVTDLDADV